MGLADAGRRQDKDVPAHFSKAAGGGGRAAAVFGRGALAVRLRAEPGARQAVILQRYDLCVCVCEVELISESQYIRHSLDSGQAHALGVARAHTGRADHDRTPLRAYLH